MNKLKKILFAAILFTFTILLTGCAEAIIHVTANKDGSSDIEYKLNLNKSTLALLASSGTGDPLEEMKNSFKHKGFKVENYNTDQTTGVIAKKHFKTAEEVASFYNTNDLGNVGSMPKVTVTKGFFIDKYVLDGDVDLSKMTSSTGTEQDLISNAMLSQIKMKFMLTLPVKTDSNNAAEVTDNGKTLSWNLVPGENNKIKLEASTPNIVSIAAVSAVTLGFTAIIIVIVILRIKNKNISA